MKYLHLAIALYYVVLTLANYGSLGLGEWVSIAQTPAFFFVTWFMMKKNYTGYYLAGVMMGLVVEYITEAYWEYSLNVFFAKSTPIWNDISPYVVLGWGFSFTVFVLISDKLYPMVRRLFDSEGGRGGAATDPWHLVFDALLGVPYFVAYELFGMNLLGLWRYLPVTNWTTIVPVIKYPLEALVGAALFAMVLPTFVRHWGPHLKASFGRQSSREATDRETAQLVEAPANGER